MCCTVFVLLVYVGNQIWLQITEIIFQKQTQSRVYTLVQFNKIDIAVCLYYARNNNTRTNTHEHQYISAFLRRFQYFSTDRSSFRAVLPTSTRMYLFSVFFFSTHKCEYTYTFYRDFRPSGGRTHRKYQLLCRSCHGLKFQLSSQSSSIYWRLSCYSKNSKRNENAICFTVSCFFFIVKYFDTKVPKVSNEIYLCIYILIA